jgi:hypothetical protein
MRAARLCDQLASGNGQPIAGQLRPVFDAMWDISQTLAAHLPAASAHRRAAVPNGPQLAELDAVVDPGGPPSAGPAADDVATSAAPLPEPGEPVGFAVHEQWDFGGASMTLTTPDWISRPRSSRSIGCDHRHCPSVRQRYAGATIDLAAPDALPVWCYRATTRLDLSDCGPDPALLMAWTVKR